MENYTMTSKNRYHTLYILALILPLFVWSSKPVTHKDTETKEISFVNTDQPGTFGLYNINGDIKVESYSGSTVKMIITRTIEADNQAMLQKALNELSLQFDSSGQQIWVYLKAPFIQVCRNGNHLSYRNIDHGDDYEFSYAFKVMVPGNTSLRTSTINGSIDITGTRDSLDVQSINGSLNLSGVSGITDVSTINGAIEIHYLQAPNQNCRFSTINGDITAFYPANLSAIAELKTMHGDLYTDMDNWHVQPIKEVIHNRKHGNRINYRISRNNSVKFGDGGPVYQFKTLNGDIIIKKNK